jgi:hypothetical protein
MHQSDFRAVPRRGDGGAQPGHTGADNAKINVMKLFAERTLSFGHSELLNVGPPRLKGKTDA